MNAGTVLAAKFATPTANRRKFLATSAALLAAPVSLRAGDVFVPHFLGANTAISGYGLFEAIDLLRKLGFQSIEIQNLLGTPEPTRDKYPGFRLDEADDDLKSRIKQALRDFQLVTTHLPYNGLEYFSPGGEQARIGMETMEMALEATAFLGAKIGVVHPKPGPGMSLKETWPFMIRRFRRWGDMAKAGGFRLALETGYPTSVDDFIRLVHEVDHDRVGATIDVGHQGRYEELARRVRPENRGTRLIRRLREIKYEGVLVFEIGGPPAEMPTYLANAKRKLDGYLLK